MESRPAGIDDGQLIRSVRDGWGFSAGRAEYVPLGFGSHHWVLTDPAGGGRFVTVDDLDRRPEPGAAARGSLARAFAAARELRDGGLEFVIAPMAARDGSVLRDLNDRYTVAVFPVVDGSAGSFGDVMEPGERAALIDVLAVLHGARARALSGVPRRDLGPIEHSVHAIDDAIGQAGHRWDGGPFSEPARRWLGDHRAEVESLVARTAARAARVATMPGDLVVTHGEPHPGNVMCTAGGLALIDWDTVGLARPERDLWWFGDDESLLARYTERSGTVLDADAIALFRDAWVVADLAVYLHQFRAAHEVDEDTEHAWRVLNVLRLAPLD